MKKSIILFFITIIISSCSLGKKEINDNNNSTNIPIIENNISDITNKEISEEKNISSDIDNQTEIEAEKIIEDKPINNIEQISFDSCGKIEKYKNESWYSNFIKNIDVNNISESCLSIDKDLFISISYGSYCEAGKIYKYNISLNNLTEAVFNDKGRGCVGWPMEFGKRDGNIIPLQGNVGDAGCRTKMYYNYNFIDNIIELVRECGMCEGDTKETCENH